jgi:alpha-glucosidase
MYTKYDEISRFLKAGSVIPKYPVQQYVSELEFDELTLDLYYKEGKGEVSLRRCKTAMIIKGRYSFLTFQLTGKQMELNIQLHKEGKYDTSYSKYKINLIGLPLKLRVSRLTMKNCHRY